MWSYPGLPRAAMPRRVNVRHVTCINNLNIVGFSISTTPIVMQGIPLLILTFAVLYLGRKLLSFLKALQAIQYVVIIINTTLMVLT
jgi:hypothetical protein